MLTDNVMNAEQKRISHTTYCTARTIIFHYNIPLPDCKGNLAKEIREWQKRNDCVLTLEDVLDNTELQEVIYKHAKRRKL
jgi:hypothetical protein